MNLDCRVLSTACPRVFEECRDEIRHGLSTEKAKSSQSTQGKVKRSGRKTPKTLVVGVCLAVKIYIPETNCSLMTLEDFLKKGRKKGSIPLSYKEVTVGLNGTTKVEYENHLYSKAKANAARLMNQLRQSMQLQGTQSDSSQSADGLIEKLYGEEVVIHTAEGFHYGTLCGYDGKNFKLDGYHFDKRLVDNFEYEFSRPFFSESTRIIPAKDYISISEIPMVVEED